MRWLIGFFLHEMAFGLLSIFLPLYVTGTVVGGTLVDVGVMISLATFLGIPFSFFWGYLGDKIGHYKPFILVSFSAMTIFLYFFASTTSIVLLILLYAVIAVFHVAHEAPKNVLIAESYSRHDWEKNFASYELLTEFGWLIGLVLGFLMSLYGWNGSLILLFCCFLNLAAFLTSAIFVVDPPLIFERGLAGMERTLNFAWQGVTLVLKTEEGEAVERDLKGEKASAYYAGLILFSLATSMLFTPLPVFFSKDLALSSSIVFAVFIMNSAGACMGYFFVKNRIQPSSGRGAVKKTALARAVLTLLLVAAIVSASISTKIFGVGVLVLMGFAYAVFLINTLSISMELLPQGRSGLFNVLVGVGGALGCLVGPLLAGASGTSGFLYVFLISGAVFILSYLAFKIFAH
jgi:MFS family permease